MAILDLIIIPSKMVIVFDGDIEGLAFLLYLFLTSTLDGRELSASRSGCFALLAKNPGTH